MYSERHKHVTDVKLDLTVVLLDRTLLFGGLFFNNPLNKSVLSRSTTVKSNLTYLCPSEYISGCYIMVN